MKRDKGLCGKFDRRTRLCHTAGTLKKVFSQVESHFMSRQACRTTLRQAGCAKRESASTEAEARLPIVPDVSSGVRKNEATTPLGKTCRSLLIICN